jgi:RNA polymerase sigma factor (sigma-70 family)
VVMHKSSAPHRPLDESCGGSLQASWHPKTPEEVHAAHDGGWTKIRPFSHSRVMAGDSPTPRDDARSADADVPADSTYHLLERAKGGDREALEVLFARHIPTLRRWASGRLPRWARDVADTQDLVQDTVLQVFKRMEAFEPRGDGALQAYLRQAVMNRIRNEFRSKGRRPSFESFDERAPSDHTSPLEAAIRHQQLDRYDAALSRLSEQERDLIVARVEVGLTYEEIAEALGKPSWNAARMAIARALVRLAEELKRGR